MYRLILSIFCLGLMVTDYAQTPLKLKVAASVMKIWPDTFALSPNPSKKLNADEAVILKAMEELWYATGDAQYYQYVEHRIDDYVKQDGTLNDNILGEFKIEGLNIAKNFLTLFQVTGKEKYKKAVDLMYAQWMQYKKLNQHPISIDELYMGVVFQAQYLSVFHDTAAFNEITQQFILLEHSWDPTKIKTSTKSIKTKSSHLWARTMGWYGMALIDALDYYPIDHPGRNVLIQILNRYAKAIIKVQNTNGLWYDIIDVPKDPRNYFESSASSMMSKVLFKAVKLGYIDPTYVVYAQKAYDGLIAKCVRFTNDNFELLNSVAVSNASGTSYQEGSLDYYFQQPMVVNDPKAVGAFLQCAIQADAYAKTPFKVHKRVTLDAYYNNEIKKDAQGNDYRWHYSWEELSNSGNACLGAQFIDRGALLRTLTKAPTTENLKNTNVYIIIDADNIKDNPRPNFMNEQDANTIALWVKQGGVLLVMANDSANTDLVHMNILFQKFGVRATNNSVNMVKGDNYEMGNVFAVKGNGVFSESIKMHLKEVSALEVKAPATVVATNGDVPVMAKVNYGKGKVMIVGDPWLYNEYLDGRKLPKQYQNFQAAQQLVNWLMYN